MTKKKISNLMFIAIVGIVLILYFYASFQRGIWYKDQFLHSINENEWSGTIYTDTLHIHREMADDKVFLRFTWGTESEDYCVFFDNNAAYNESLKIYQEDLLLLTGYYTDSNFQVLFDSSGNAVSLADITVTVGGTEISSSGITNDWRPSEPLLLQLALLDKLEFRGDISKTICIFFIGFVLLLDICFPKLFFYIRHGLSVYDPEPSELYYFFQKIGRIALVILVGFLMLTTFFPLYT